MKTLFTALFAFFSISVANASFMIEPYLGYASMSFKSTFNATNGGIENSDTGTGTLYGLRLGYQLLIPYVALDYTGLSGTCKTGAGSASCSGTQLGIVAGASLPLIRPYAGYGFSNEIKINGVNGSDSQTWKGTYTKLGLGLGFIPIITVNLEYLMNNFSKYESGSLSGSTGDYFSSKSSNFIYLTVSYPISF